MTLLPLACSLPHSLYGNDVGAEGAKALGKALETNCTLRELKYAATNPHLLSMPADSGCSFAHRLAQNQLCGLDEYRGGTYTADGIIAIMEMLRTNSTIQTLEYAARHLFPCRQGPLTFHCPPLCLLLGRLEANGLDDSAKNELRQAWKHDASKLRL